MNDQPLVTVLMPCYNAEPYLREAIESILNQTYTNFELLAIDDGSTDGTYAILEEYAVKDQRMKVIKNEENIKLIRTLNKGVELAKGDYIARMDADDISALNRLEVELKYLMSNPEIDIISTGYYYISENGAIISKNIPRKHSRIACFFASFFYVPIGHGELLIKTQVLKDNPFLYTDHAIHTEDYELWSRLLRKGYCLRRIDDFLYYFRINSKSVSRQFTCIQDENFIYCAKFHHLKYTGKSHSSEIISVLVNRIKSDMSLTTFKLGLKEMATFKSFFIEKEKVSEKKIIKEIEVVYLTHLFDICCQAIKRSSGKIKLYAIWILCINIRLFFNKRVLMYLKNKVF
jgi:glycosyltransferase involved in cell wall biosynthesis